MSFGHEPTVHSFISKAEARASELEQSIRKIIKNSFTPADATANPTLQKHVQELAQLRRQGLLTAYLSFGLPMSGALKRKFGLFGTASAVHAAPATEQKPAMQRPRYTPSAEAQAIIDSVRANKQSASEGPADAGKVISGKMAETYAEAAVELVNAGAKQKEKPRRNRYFDEAVRGKPATQRPPHQPVYQAGQTEQEKQLWKDVTSRTNARSAAKPAARPKRAAVERPPKKSAPARIEKRVVPAPTPAPVQEAKTIIELPPDKVIPELTVNEIPIEGSAAPLMKIPAAPDTAFIISEPAGEAVPNDARIQNLTEELERLNRERGRKPYADALCRKIDELQGLGGFSLNHVAEKILHCNYDSLKDRMRLYRKTFNITAPLLRAPAPGASDEDRGKKEASNTDSENIVLVDVSRAPTLQKLMRDFIEGTIDARSLVRNHAQELGLNEEED